MIARANNAARDLLARLTDEAELESAAIGDVRADLALVGIDPARPIRFSRALAENAASPAGGLLARTLGADDSDREVSALELADARAVRAELTAAAPLAMAHAERLSNKAASHAARRRPSRRLWYGIGGTITALAASVLIFVTTSTRDDGLQVAYAPDSELLSREEQVAASTQDSAAAPPAGALQVPLEQLAEPAVEDSSRVARRTGNDAESQRIFEHFASIAASGSESEAGDVTGQLQPAQRASNLTVTAALILQPELAPEPLRQSDLGAGDLESLLPEAARSRMSRSIVALVTLQHSNGSTVNAMLLRLQVEYLRQSSNSGSGEDAEALILRHPIAVPPTLGQLLGEDADRFLVGELKPPAAAEQN